MMDLFWSFLDLLKGYANVLAALATLVYVVLTYRMLKALRRESTRELRLRHLEDIKSQVVKPMLNWFDSQAIPALKGEASFVIVTTRPTQRQNVELGESPYDFPRELAVNVKPREAKKGHLFAHAKEIHYEKELNAAEILLEDIDKLLSDSLSVAKGWADEMAKGTTLPRILGTSGAPEGVDSDFFAAVCLKSLIAHQVTGLRTNVPAAGGLEISDGYSGTVIARGPSETVRTWHSNAKKVADDGWQKSGLSDRFQDTLKLVYLVAELVRRIELTYDLKGDCEYMGGRNPGRIKRLWSRYARQREH